MTDDLFAWAIELAQKGTGSKLGKEFSEFFDNDAYKNLRFELLSLLEPFSSAFLALRGEGDIQQIPTKSLGSGVELILALLLQRLLSDSAKGDKILLIDEPEMHLHPTAQKKLASLLLDESKTMQVVVSSHSPYLLQCLVEHGLTNVFSSDQNGKVKVEPQKATGGYFPWSPSFGEVNFKAFGMPTIELHNELYGYIQDRSGFYTAQRMDSFLNDNGISTDHTWKNLKSGLDEPVTECTYVRHCIHHPENKLNPPYDEAKLYASIQKLIRVV